MNKCMKAFSFVVAVCLSEFLMAEELPPPCDPVLVKKPVKIVRREIKVAIIGADRPTGPADVSRG